MTNPTNNEPKTQPDRECRWSSTIDVNLPCDCKYHSAETRIIPDSLKEMTNFMPNNESWQEKLVRKHNLEILYYAGSKNDEVENLLADIQAEIDKARDNNCTIHKLKNIWCLVCAAEIADNARKEALNATILKLKGEIKNYGSDGDLVGHLLDTISSRLSEPKN